MAIWLNRTTGAGARNGTTSHVLGHSSAATAPSSGCALNFVPTVGSILVAVVGGQMSHTSDGTGAGSGWTKRQSPNQSGTAALFTKTAVGNDFLSILHNGSDYPMNWAMYEFPEGSSYTNSASLNNNTDVLPGVTSLPGNKQFVLSVYSRGSNAGGLTGGSTCSAPWIEDFDSFMQGPASGSNYFYVLYAPDQTATSVFPAFTYGVTGTVVSDRQKFTVAIYIPPEAVAVTLQRALFSGSGTQEQTGSVAAILQRATSSMSGIMLQPSGTVAATGQQVSFAGGGAHAQVGAVAATGQQVSFAGDGAHAQVGAVAATGQGATSSMSGVIPTGGAVAATTQVVALAGTGVQAQTGIVAVSVRATAAGMTGLHTQSGAVTVSLLRAAAAFAGVQVISGTVAAASGRATASLTAGQVMFGAMSTLIEELSASLSGSQIVSGGMSTAMARLLAEMVGVEHASGEMGSTVLPLMGALVGAQPFTAVVDSVLQFPTIVVGGGVIHVFGAVAATTVGAPIFGAVGVVIPEGVGPPVPGRTASLPGFSRVTDAGGTSHVTDATKADRIATL